MDDENKRKKEKTSHPRLYLWLYGVLERLREWGVERADRVGMPTLNPTLMLVDFNLKTVPVP
jgi:hypothetical protein